MNHFKYKLPFILVLLLASCNSSYRSLVKDYDKIFLTNNGDTLNGYVKVQQGVCYYISKWDLKNRDTLCIHDSLKVPKAYVLFDKNKADSYRIRKQYCDFKKNFSPDFRDLRNLVYPIKKDSLGYSVEHKSLVNNHHQKSGPIFSRQFILNDKYEIIDFKSIGKRDSLYFYYD